MTLKVTVGRLLKRAVGITGTYTCADSRSKMSGVGISIKFGIELKDLMANGKKDMLKDLSEHNTKNIGVIFTSHKFEYNKRFVQICHHRCQ